MEEYFKKNKCVRHKCNSMYCNVSIPEIGDLCSDCQIELQSKYGDTEYNTEDITLIISEFVKTPKIERMSFVDFFYKNKKLTASDYYSK